MFSIIEQTEEEEEEEGVFDMHAYASASLMYDHMMYEHVNKEKHGVRR